MTATSLRLVAVAALAAAAGCDKLRREPPDFTLPAAATLDSIYEAHGVDVEVGYSGNVVELTGVQPFEQLERGGSLWARVGPYIYLFTPATREVFEAFDGVAAVRAITRTPRGEEIARAMLLRTALEETRWRRANNLLGRALQEGTERPSRIEELVHFGEEYTEHHYNPAYAPRDRGRGGTPRP